MNENTTPTTWSVFGLELSPRTIAQIRADAEARYPSEACGLGLARVGRAEVDQIVAIPNVAPGPGSFTFEERAYLHALEKADEEGRTERLVYHSHPDAGAYLSAVDRAAFAPGGHPPQPDLVHVVVEVRHGLAGEVAAFRWNVERERFDEAHPAPPTLPDLELRGGPSPRPVAPVGGQLATRRLGPAEARVLAGLAEGRRLTVDARAETLIRFFERGFLSPLTGFQRPDQVRTVEALGRTPRGVPWRSPVTLEVNAAPEWPSGQIVELVNRREEPLALMVIAQRQARPNGRVMLGGPVFCYPSDTPDAWDLRAEWLSLRAERILAVPTGADWVDGQLDLGPYDVVLASPRVRTRVPDGVRVRPLADLPGDPWLTAAMAQNQGATHFALPPGAPRRDLEQTLVLVPLVAPEPTPA